MSGTILLFVWQKERMQVVLTHIAKHHRTHHHPLTLRGSMYHYGGDVLVEQYNGMVEGEATAVARELSQQQGGTGWCSVYDVPVLRTLAQARQDGWDPSVPLRKQRAPTATFFAGCRATWNMDEGSLQVAADCNIAPFSEANSKWTPQLQAQLFPDTSGPALPPDVSGPEDPEEQAFGLFLQPGDSLLRQLREACLDLDIPHYTEADLQALMLQFPEATNLEALVQVVRQAAAAATTNSTAREEDLSDMPAPEPPPARPEPDQEVDVDQSPPAPADSDDEEEDQSPPAPADSDDEEEDQSPPAPADSDDEEEPSPLAPQKAEEPQEAEEAELPTAQLPDPDVVQAAASIMTA